MADGEANRIVKFRGKSTEISPEERDRRITAAVALVPVAL